MGRYKGERQAQQHEGRLVGKMKGKIKNERFVADVWDERIDDCLMWENPLYGGKRLSIQDRGFIQHTVKKWCFG